MKQLFVFILKSLFIGSLLTVNSVDVLAQSIQDTIHVEEIEIISQGIKRFQAGAKVETIPSAQFELLQDGNLENMLSRNTPISLKGTAGGLSTIRFRGTSPDHTSINFGGINLNSLTLGHSNISNIPMYLFDEIGLQFGSSSAVNGSGNIGGAIHLGLNNNWTDGYNAEFRVAQGSFGEQLYGTKLYLGNGKWESVTRLYYYNKRNKFKFLNTSIKDFATGAVGVEDVQKNARIENKGILQELNYRLANHEFIKLRVWLEDDWHNTQQNQATNHLSPEKKETYKDEHVRVWASYDNRIKPFKYHVGVGYVSDNGIFNETPNPIKTKRILGDAYIEHDLFTNSSYKIGTKATRITPSVHAYSKTLDYEDRVDLFLSYNQHLFNRIRLTVNLRQGFVTNYDLPFVPAIGISYRILSRNNHLLKLNGNIAKSYRVPTFNDRYWEPGGNPNLLPEDGMNYELGFKYSHYTSLIKSSIKVNAFFMDVNNWLLWKNGGSYWYAENVQRVKSQGIEVLGNLKYNIGKLVLINGLNYAFTNSKRIESLNDNSAINRQLEYVPLHRVVAFTSADYKRFSFSLDGSYTHEQYTDETENNILTPYFLLNITTSIRLDNNDSHKFRINFMINNILNKNYQSTIDYAMPRINYRISLTYNFNKKNN